MAEDYDREKTDPPLNKSGTRIVMRTIPPSLREVTVDRREKAVRVYKGRYYIYEIMRVPTRDGQGERFAFAPAEVKKPTLTEFRKYGGKSQAQTRKLSQQDAEVRKRRLEKALVRCTKSKGVKISIGKNHKIIHTCNSRNHRIIKKCSDNIIEAEHKKNWSSYTAKIKDLRELREERRESKKSDKLGRKLNKPKSKRKKNIRR